MRWILRVEPEPGELRDLTAELCWPDSSRKSAPEVWSWDQADDDMLALSARFPSLLFVLEVHNAEEPGLYAPERWYFKAGKVHKVTAVISFPEFDASKLA